MPDFDVLVLGDLNPDVIVRGDRLRPAFGQREQAVDEITLTVGSSAGIFACGATRLGLRVALIGVVGADAFGTFMLDTLSERGVDVYHCRVDPTKPSGASVVLSEPGDRAILTAAGAMATLSGTDVPERLLRASRHVHVASYFLLPDLQPAIPRILETARGSGATTSMDTNWDPRGAWSGLAEALARTGVAFPNEAEATALTGRGTVQEAGQSLLQMGVQLVVIKRGSDGAIAIMADEPAIERPAMRVTPLDTTGAGDSFDAGFIAGRLAGMSIAASLDLAIACGSLSTRSAGGTAGQPTRDEALAAIGSATTPDPPDTVAAP